MEIQVGVWELLTLGVTLLIAFFGCIWKFAKYTLEQLDKRLDARFEAQANIRKQELQGVDAQLEAINGQMQRQEQAREAGKKHWDNQFGEIERQLDDHRERIIRLEGAMEKAPSHEHLGDMHERINGIAEEMSELSGEFKGAKRTLELIHSFLLTGGKS